MLRDDAHLVPTLFAPETLSGVPTRDGFGHGVVVAGERDSRVVVLCADLAESTRAQWFRDKFPERYVEVGVAEQNMATVASGMAVYGKIPYIASYAAFSPGRNWEQIRTTICLNDVPVKIMGMHAGISVGPDGATHQPLEDIAIMRMLPRMQVLSPCDAVEAQKAVEAVATTGKPAYIRFGREKTPVFTTEKTPFSIGGAYTLWEQEEPDVALLGTGPVLYNALRAAEALSHEGVRSVVANIHSIKPMDEQFVISLARRVKAVVTVEEHQVMGGLGGAVAEVLSHNHPTRMKMVGVHDAFGQSGTPEELLRHYGIDTESIMQAVRDVRT